MLARILGVRIFDIEASSRCNVRCRFCPREKLPATGFMSEDTYRCFLEQVPLRNTDSVAFVGLGEPTLNPLLPDFIRETKRRYPKTVTWVTTNGTTLVENLLAKLVDSGLDILDVSFNGLDRESYEQHMRGACYEKTLANVERAVAYLQQRRSKTRLQINYVVGPNGGEQEKLIRASWRARGIAQFRRQPLHNRAGAAGSPGVEDRARRLEAGWQRAQETIYRGLGGRGCMLFRAMTFVTWQGDVLYCSHDVARRHRLGNVREESWRKIRQRKRMILRNKTWPAMCNECTDRLRFDIEDEIDRKIREEACRCARRWAKASTGRTWSSWPRRSRGRSV